MLGTVRGCEGVVLSYVDEQHLAITTQMSACRRPAACLSIVCLQSDQYYCNTGIFFVHTNADALRNEMQFSIGLFCAGLKIYLK